jgi:uracil-DNA glycosylase
MSESLSKLMREARACRACEETLLPEPRPVFWVGKQAKLYVAGQAPGKRVYETGRPWNDASGDLLRAWLGLTREDFYDRSRIAIVSIGLCYPGTVDGVDLPPCRDCAPLWQPRFRAALPGISLTLLVGSYAHAYYLKDSRKKNVSETVRAWREYLPEFFVLPHPSWRNLAWMKKNPWFGAEVIPALRRRVKRVLRPV